MKNLAQKNIVSFVYFLSVTVFLFLPFLITTGHGSGGSFEVTENKYTIGIGYDVETIEANTPVRFDFNILKEQAPTHVDFQSLWVRLETQDPEQHTVFASGIHKPSIGLPTMLFTFPDPGAYTLYARFETQNNEKIVEVNIPFFVEKETNSSSYLNWNIFLPLFTAILGTLLGFIIRKKVSKV